MEPQHDARGSDTWTTDAGGMSGVPQQTDFRISTSDDELPAVVRVEGELDSFTAAQLREHLAGVVENEAVVIDLCEVAFIDSSGLGALVGGVRRIREAGRGVAICCTRPSVLRLLDVTGFDRLVPVVSTRTDARILLAGR